MKCPVCKNVFKDEGRSKGGQKSRRTISPEDQAKMQAARKAKKTEGKVIFWDVIKGDDKNDGSSMKKAVKSEERVCQLLGKKVDIKNSKKGFLMNGPGKDFTFQNKPKMKGEENVK